MTLPTSDARPIGIFDSGVGGLTVLRTLARRFPQESFIYLGDTARVPYGTKSPRTVERYTLQVADHLQRHGVKGVVAACNTASALGLGALRAHQPKLPVQGVIVPGCRSALNVTQTGRVGVIGTRATISSGAYRTTLNLLNPTIEVSDIACPLFVPLAEEGWTHHAATEMIVRETLTPLLDSDIDTLILGCTHYPVLKEVIQKVMGEGVMLVDSAEAVADELEQRLSDTILPNHSGAERTILYLVTDEAARFASVARRFLEEIPLEQVEMVDL
ncbi:glutamate racemase [Magnetococcus marinus MC-1]|uniref:Glutamate racemase n=1 Tax=Magnetococcus marinus (strain ATCC BAA-1437 / JCM 17883 / MC-1) TaxID=156889 RepID=A0LCM8_MAGMM|nr:glutamate racemase [Magnetococcus marinus]ABK45721.1 glutamate racemase [Magnetococcus marinus MC-1]